MTDWEHTPALQEVQSAAAVLRKRVQRLHWIAGGEGYDNMGRRELEQARNRVDEAMFWIAAASRSLNAGAKRAQSLGYGQGGVDAIPGARAETDGRDRDGRDDRPAPTRPGNRAGTQASETARE